MSTTTDNPAGPGPEDRPVRGRTSPVDAFDLLRVAVVWYTDLSLPDGLAAACFRHLLASTEEARFGGLPVVCVAQGERPAWYAEHQHLEDALCRCGKSGRPRLTWVNVGKKKRCLRSIYEQIQAGVHAARVDVVALAEHDVLYSPAHWQVLPLQAAHHAPAVVYNTHAVRLTRRGWIPHSRPLLSALAAKVDVLEDALEQRLDRLSAGGRWAWSEIGSGDGVQVWHTRIPCKPLVDVRHGHNLTGDRRAAHYLTHAEGWGDYRTWLEQLSLEAEEKEATP